MNLRLLSALMFLSPINAPVEAQTLSGPEIMTELQHRHDAMSERTELMMQIYDSRNRVRERRLSIMARQGEDGVGKALLKFLSPADIRNVGLLTWDRGEEGEDDQWLYMPASETVRRISGGNKKSEFMGTDLTYEDLRPENLNRHTYQVIREEERDGHPCWVVEALPGTEAERGETSYGKRLFWIRKDVYFIIHVEFYNHSERLIKTATFEDLEHIKDQMWRSNRSTFERVLARTRTVTITQSRELDVDLPESLFTQQGLRRPPGRR